MSKMNDAFFRHFSFQVERKDLYNGDLDILVPNIPENCENLSVEVTVSSTPTDNEEPRKEKRARKNRQYRNYVQAVKRAKKR